MKSKWSVAVIIMILIIIGCWTKFFYDVKAEIRRRDPEVMAQEIENALNEVKPGWEKKSVTVDRPVTFADDKGNTIVYHCLETTYYGNEEEITDVDTNAVVCVIEIANAGTVRNCNVNEAPALLCEKKGRAYLCWTLSPEYSFVIEYTSGAVLEEDIFRIAESLQLS